MLDRDRMINTLVDKASVGLHELFDLRRGLRSLTLVALAKRYREVMGEDPYHMSQIAA